MAGDFLFPVRPNFIFLFYPHRQHNSIQKGENNRRIIQVKYQRDKGYFANHIYIIRVPDKLIRSFSDSRTSRDAVDSCVPVFSQGAHEPPLEQKHQDNQHQKKMIYRVRVIGKKILRDKRHDETGVKCHHKRIMLSSVLNSTLRKQPFLVPV